MTGACYENNQFDRGHLTRREDLEYGASEASALAAADDTCHWTNCTPQAAKFNEGKQLWAGLELHILEQAVEKNRFKAQVITGPVFGARDPVIPGFAGRTIRCATGKSWRRSTPPTSSSPPPTCSTSARQIEPATRGAPEIPFTPYKTFQTTIANIEALTDLTLHLRPGRQARRLEGLRSARQGQGDRRLCSDHDARRRRAACLRTEARAKIQRGPLAQLVRAEDS